jgi:hypothetical protein
MPHQDAVRDHLVTLLRKSEAHAGFENSVKDVPKEKRGVRPVGSPHSLWELLEHIRIAQLDILEFSQSAGFPTLKWPDAYWPKTPEPPTESAWRDSIQSVVTDRAAFIALIRDPKRDLFIPLPWGDGQTLMREALLLADHTAYHTGEIVLTRRLLDLWP